MNMKKGIYFAAHYFIIAETIVLFWAAFYKSSTKLGVLTIVAGVVLAVIAWVLSFIFKHIIKRIRPHAIRALFKAPDMYSFPSSHATVLGALAVFIYQLKPSFGILAIVVALCIGIARVFARVHYVSDIVAGFILGGLIAYFFSGPIYLFFIFL
jgi:undecaprenyl-diphosphatase